MICRIQTRVLDPVDFYMANTAMIKKYFEGSYSSRDKHLCAETSICVPVSFGLLY